MADRDHFRPGLQLVQIIRPLLHHLPALGQMGRAVVGAPVRVAHGMGELVFDEIGADAEHFIQNHPCHRPEAVPAHLFLVDSHASHGSENGVVAYWSLVRPCPRKCKATAAGERVQFAQNFQGLPGERDNMRGVGFGYGTAPPRRVQVDLRIQPCELARAYEYQGRKAQRTGSVPS